MTFANRTFVLVSTVEYGRKETKNVAQTNENGTRYCSEEKVKHLSELIIDNYELIIE